MQRLRKSKKLILAFTLTEIMAVSAIVASIPAGAYARVKGKATQMTCLNNMRQIGQSIMMYQTGEGKYPAASFFPDKPFEDDNSIVKILEDSGAGIPREMWICPSAPGKLRERGLTFIYNDAFAGRQSLPRPEKAWVLIEVNCVSKKIAPPHPDGYNIVFADGHVITSRSLPPSITSKQRAAIDRLHQNQDHGGLPLEQACVKPLAPRPGAAIVTRLIAGRHASL